MLDISLLFKIGAFGILVILLDKIFRAAGRDEVATISNLTGIVIILIMLVSLISKLFNAVKTMFQF